jgi:hypothetical protein
LLLTLRRRVTRCQRQENLSASAVSRAPSTPVRASGARRKPEPHVRTRRNHGISWELKSFLKSG